MQAPAFEKVLNGMPNFGRACYIALESWGYLPGEAEHEGRVELFFKMAEGREIRHPQTYIQLLLRNREIDKQRARKKLHCIELFEDSLPAAYDESLTAEDFLKELAGLSDKQKEILFMLFFMGFKQQELAEWYGVELGTIKSRMGRACARLKELRGK